MAKPVEKSAQNQPKDNNKETNQLKKPATGTPKPEEKADEAKNLETRARVLELLEKRLDSNNLNQNNLNAEFKKIKNMYSSFEGATMTSTIANIDIEEMCYCFSCAIEKHVDFFLQNILPTYTPSDYNNLEKQKSKPQQAAPVVKDKVVEEVEPKPKETAAIASQKPKNTQVIDIQDNYDDNTQFYIYKGAAVPKEGAQGDEDDEDADVDYTSLTYSKQKTEDFGLYDREDDDEVLHTESKTLKADDDDEVIVDEEEKVEDSQVPAGKDRKNYEDYDPEDIAMYDEDKFQDFLKQSLRDSILFNAVKGAATKDDYIDEQLLQDKYNSTKYNIQSSYGVDKSATEAREESETEKSYSKQGEDEYQEEEIEEEEEATEKEEESDAIKDSGLNFTFEESQYVNIALNPDEVTLAQRTKRVFERTYNDTHLSPEDIMKSNSKQFSFNNNLLGIGDTVSKEAVSNYCKNLMVTSKMEKEVIIVSLVYIERLIIATNMYLNSINWKKNLLYSIYYCF